MDADTAGGRGDRPLPTSRRRPLLARLPEAAAERERILAAHDAALHTGQPGYLDPRTGLVVLTAGYLWENGRCCRTGCRHCPYEPGARASEAGDR